MTPSCLTVVSASDRVWALDSRHGLCVHGQTDIGRFIQQPTVMGDGSIGSFAAECWWRRLWFSLDTDKAPVELAGAGLFGDEDSCHWPIWIDQFDCRSFRRKWNPSRVELWLLGTNYRKFEMTTAACADDVL